MTQAEQVKASIIEKVTGVAPTIHAEAGDVICMQRDGDFVDVPIVYPKPRAQSAPVIPERAQPTTRQEACNLLTRIGGRMVQQEYSTQALILVDIARQIIQLEAKLAGERVY